MKKKLLVIDNYDSFTYNLLQIVEELNHDYSVIKNDQLSLEAVDEFSKIIISPGPGLPSEAGLIKEVISKFAASKSILGVCLGHQAIVEVFGGELFNFPVVHHGIAANIRIIYPVDYLFENLPEEFEAGLYHSWAASTSNFPDCLRITSVSSNNVIMSVSHLEYDLRGLQFHPESLMTRCGAQIINNWLSR